MLNERQTRILNLLGRNELTSVAVLAEELKVSSVTIRQDLNFLEGEGLVRRIHGGAMLEDADDLANRLGFNYDRKLRIARKAAGIVKEGETILIESGSANVLLARELAQRKGITIVTTNVYIARQF
nr:DeoR/GlpR family DNA-binding transcription regulator [Bacteroidales bacterium]